MALRPWVFPGVPLSGQLEGYARIRVTVTTRRRDLPPVAKRAERPPVSPVRVPTAAVTTVALDATDSLGSVDSLLVLYPLLRMTETTFLPLGARFESRCPEQKKTADDQGFDERLHATLAP